MTNRAGLAKAFQAHRPSLVALGYRMLGDIARAEDIVQDAWLRLQSRSEEIHSPKGFLIRAVTRLCLNELGSARARKEETRGDRLPEPVDLEHSGLDNVTLQEPPKASTVCSVVLHGRHN